MIHNFLCFSPQLFFLCCQMIKPFLVLVNKDLLYDFISKVSSQLIFLNYLNKYMISSSTFAYTGLIKNWHLLYVLTFITTFRYLIIVHIDHIDLWHFDNLMKDAMVPLISSNNPGLQGLTRSWDQRRCGNIFLKKGSGFVYLCLSFLLVPFKKHLSKATSEGQAKTGT